MNNLMKFHLKKNKFRLSDSIIMKCSATLLAGLFFAVLAEAIPQRPSPARLVNDFANILTYTQESQLEQFLVDFDDSTSNQIAVVTVTDLEGYSPAEYGTELGIKWEIGSKKFDNGIVVLIKPKTASSKGEISISVGYGLEGAIPDSYAKRIIETQAIPSFREGNYFEGTVRSCAVLMKLAKGEISEPPAKKDKGKSDFTIFIIFGLLLISVFSVLSDRKNKGGKNNGGNNGGNGNQYYDDTIERAIIYGSILGSGRRHYGGPFGGGSFGGGSFGGSSFGGGFGGFGGGSFGGGGASGSW